VGGDHLIAPRKGRSVASPQLAPRAVFFLRSPAPPPLTRFRRYQVPPEMTPFLPDPPSPRPAPFRLFLRRDADPLFLPSWTPLSRSPWTGGPEGNGKSAFSKWRVRRAPQVLQLFFSSTDPFSCAGSGTRPFVGGPALCTVEERPPPVLFGTPASALPAPLVFFGYLIHRGFSRGHCLLGAASHCPRTFPIRVPSERPGGSRERGPLTVLLRAGFYCCGTDALWQAL